MLWGAGEGSAEACRNATRLVGARGGGGERCLARGAGMGCAKACRNARKAYALRGGGGRALRGEGDWTALKLAATLKGLTS